MDSNTFLLRFGLDPDQFELCQFDPELIDGEWVYRAKMRDDRRLCPSCGKADAVVVNDRRVRKVRCSLSEAARDVVLVEKPRFLCRRCRKTFTPRLKGVARYASISDATKAAIRRAFAEKQTFSTVARHFGITEGYAIALFDAMYPAVPGRPLPRTLCIDEICFVDRVEGKYAFMKSRWRLFELRKSRIPDGRYHHAATGEWESHFGMLMRCLRTSQPLWEAWSSLQEVLTWNIYGTWTEAAEFVERVASRLIGSGSPLLGKVGQSYRKWKAQIANGLSTNQGGRRLSNGIAECLNNQIKTIKKISNGCLNFERFRKRVLLILTYARTI